MKIKKFSSIPEMSTCEKIIAIAMTIINWMFLNANTIEKAMSAVISMYSFVRSFS